MFKFSLRKTLCIIFIILLCVALFRVVLKPVFLNHYISHVSKYARGRFVCSLDNKGQHIGQLYRINNGKKELLRTSVSNSCIFSRPKINAGFFVLAIGGGGGATPYAPGVSGQIISKHKPINEPVIVIKIGKGGHGTYVDEENKFVDAKDGAPTVIDALKIKAMGGSKSTRMTPLGNSPEIIEHHIPKKYLYLYGLSKSVKYGQGGQFDKRNKNSSAKAPSGHSGLVVIQW